MAVNGISSSWDTASSSSTSSSSSTIGDQQDRFLKLLVAQLNNQDPMNPMDNAEMTTQIAQINTVTGIQQLNETMKSMSDQFTSLQVMQGGTMVGRTVMTEGDTLNLDTESKTGGGAFDLDGKAANVTVQIYSSSGKMIGTLPMGSLEAGRYSFAWDTSTYSGTGDLTFKVVATNGSSAVGSTALMSDKVLSVGAEDGALKLSLLKGGTVDYSAIKAIL
ncbi:flagellar hook assembly protein FlgD [Variovorax sp. HJSM1_2]|uniref:flagellar hook assembly protein FlgD n=1 Tax=Variovorax sp. HJSM1_2 TaxID=3366263 RepID=UPI003BD1DEAF